MSNVEDANDEERTESRITPMTRIERIRFSCERIGADRRHPCHPRFVSEQITSPLISDRLTV
jgi:hypothetical protein